LAHFSTPDKGVGPAFHDFNRRDPPRRSDGPCTWTAWRYSDFPTIWPGIRPGFLEQDRHLAPDHGILRRALLRRQQRLKPLQPVIGLAGSTCARSAAGVPGRAEYLKE
jgi:hypothetical protein